MLLPFNSLTQINFQNNLFAECNKWANKKSFFHTSSIQNNNFKPFFQNIFKTNKQDAARNAARDAVQEALSRGTVEAAGDPQVAGERAGEAREDRDHVPQGARDAEVRREAHSHC